MSTHCGGPVSKKCMTTAIKLKSSIQLGEENRKESENALSV
jgi:hypothetical protein